MCDPHIFSQEFIDASEDKFSNTDDIVGSYQDRIVVDSHAESGYVWSNNNETTPFPKCTACVELASLRLDLPSVECQRFSKPHRSIYYDL